MTNREYMQTLDNETFAFVMHTLYFYPKLLFRDDFIKSHSTPLESDIVEWLNAKYDSESDFWKYINQE